MQIDLLGPLEVRGGDGAPLEIAGTRLRALLILLALEPGRVVSTPRLVDGIWAEDPPAGAANALQALVSRLRRSLPGVAVETHPSGYRLGVGPDAVDVARFERLAADGRSALADDPAAAAQVLRAALGLWRGPALPEVAELDVFRAPVARLAELRLATVEDRVDADLRLGRAADLIAELTVLVAENPLRERLVGALMRALVAAGRPGEALTAYERARAQLAEELGADPSAELSALHTAILRGEPVVESTVDEGRRTNLRAGLTSFVGRDADLVRVRKLVGEYRLTTLTGPGGSGKTRLAVEAAHSLVDQTSDGVWLVELAPVVDGADVPKAVLAALGMREQAYPGLAASGDPVDRLAAALRRRGTLLVLDNCEHLIGAVAALADRLLGECPRLRILATSREPVGITGEALWPVAPLGLPAEDATVEEAMAVPAVRLLVDRAAAARPGFEVTDRTVAAVVQICRALDGMPLAVELAAARLRTMTVDQLATRLDDRFRLLTGGSRTALPRHQTLRAVVDWSWELLSEPERALLSRLAVFSGGATVTAAERVCAGGPVAADDVLDLLSALTDKSLLVGSDEENPRYRMLETIKAYGLSRLDEAGERERLRRAHAGYLLDFVMTADPHLRRAEQLDWLRLLTAEHDNITAALRGAVAAGDAATAVGIAAGAGWYWWLNGHKAEGMELTLAALAVPGEVHYEVLAGAYALCALFATAGLGDEQEASRWIHQARFLVEGKETSAPMLRFIVPMDEMVAGFPDGVGDAGSALASLLADGDPWMRAQGLINRARIRLRVGGDRGVAESELVDALALFEAIGERWGISFARSTLADLLAQQGRLADALTQLERGIVVVTEMGTVEDVLFMRGRQAQLRFVHGDLAGSAAAMAAARREAVSVNWPDALGGLAQSAADLARWAGDAELAKAELARAESILADIDVHPVFQAMMRDTRGYLAAGAGDLTAARTHRAAAVELVLRSPDAQYVGQILTGVADQALREGRPERAARVLGVATAVRGGPDLSRMDVITVERAVRAALGDATFAEAARSVSAVTFADVPAIVAEAFG